MDRTKIIAIVFLIIVLGLTVVTLKIVGDKNNITKERDTLLKEKAALTERNDDLQGKCNKLEKDVQDREDRIQKITSELDSISKQKTELQKRFEDVSRQRDELVEKLKTKPKEETQVPVIKSTTTPATAAVSAGSEEYWADYVKMKAALQVQLEDLNKQYTEAKLRIVDLEKNNKELSLKIDELTKERDRLTNDMDIKEREMGNISRDLVSEREARKIAMEELVKLRGENVGLKRELTLLNKEKVRLQNNIKDIADKKNILEQKISGVENIMKEKSMDLQELQQQLDTTIKGKPDTAVRETASVELPPIVVKPSVGGRGLRGEVLAVNPEEKFIVVNLGENTGVVPGSLMRVMRGSREIGTVEIVETRKEISAADIKESLDGFSIQEGDIVISK